MTDIYIRRMDSPGPRRRILGRVIAVFVTVAVVAGLVLVIRAGCSHGEAGEPQAAESTAPETGPDTDERAREESPRAMPAAEPGPAPGAARPAAPAAARPEALRTRAPEAATAAAATAAPAGDAGRLLAQAEQARARGDLVEARRLGLGALASAADPQTTARVEALLGAVNTALVFSPREMPQKTDYTVQSGDTLAKLAKEFGTTVEMIRKGNMIQGSMIRVGDRLRILTGSFSVRVNKTDNTLVVYLDDTFFKRYRVGTGEYNRTPVGDFLIDDRIPQPTWWRPDGKAIPYGHPDNELGTHWLSLNIRGYGIHGTWEPDTIGQQASAGCIRLLNEEIEELYTLLPIGTPVKVEE